MGNLDWVELGETEEFGCSYEEEGSGEAGSSGDRSWVTEESE